MRKEKQTSSHHLTGKNIIIDGAGVAGLSLTLALLEKWSNSLPFRITIYEQYAEKEVEREGYPTSIPSDSGRTRALRKTDLLEKLRRRADEVSDASRGAMYVWNKRWEPLMCNPPSWSQGRGSRPPLSLLRQVLVEEVKRTGTEIVWSTTCDEASSLADGRVRVRFSNGDEAECDLLVVTDGSSSTLRRSLRPNDEPKFAGSVHIIGKTSFPDGIPELFSKDYGMVMSGKGVGMWISPIDRKDTIWSVSRYQKEPREVTQPPLPETEAEMLKQEALNMIKDLEEPAQTIIQASVLSTIRVANAREKIPLAHANRVKNVIYIGDSESAMSLFAGKGAEPLVNGWDMGQALYEHNSLEAALAAYDKLSIPRCKGVNEVSRTLMNAAHSSGMKWTFFRGALGLLRFHAGT